VIVQQAFQDALGTAVRDGDVEGCPPLRIQEKGIVRHWMSACLTEEKVHQIGRGVVLQQMVQHGFTQDARALIQQRPECIGRTMVVALVGIVGLNSPTR